MRCRAFTLIDLVVVVVVIIALAILLQLAIHRQPHRRPEIHDYAITKQLETALASYQSSYQGRLPFALSCGQGIIAIDSQPDLARGAYTQTFAATSGPHTIASTDTGHYGMDTYQLLVQTLNGSDATLNPRQQKLLELDRRTTPYVTGNYTDTYGHNLEVTLDLSGKGLIPAADVAGADTPLTRDLAVWSLGKDGQQRRGAGPTDPLNRDNVTCWFRP